MIAYYKRCLYDEWFHSLTAEQQEYIRRKEQEKRDSDKQKVNLLLHTLCTYASLFDSSGYFRK